MADEEPKPKRSVLKNTGWSIGGLATGLALMGPLKEQFVTKQETVATEIRLERIEKQVDKFPDLVEDAKKEIMVTIRRSYDNTDKNIKDVEARYQRENDRQDRDIQALESANFIRLNKGRTN